MKSCSIFLKSCLGMLLTIWPAQASEQRAASPRVISLSPSNTEIVYALTAQDALVAVSDVCDFPPAARGKPKVGSFVSLKIEKIAALKPDMVLLVNGQERALANLAKYKIPVTLLSNESIGDISANTKKIGMIVGKRKPADKIAREFVLAVEQLKAIVAKSKGAPKVFFCVWPNPLMTAGQKSFVNEAATVCGGTNIAAGTKAAYPVINMEKVIAGKPDLIVFPHEAQAQSFWKSGAWKSLAAVRNGKIYFLPPPQRDPLLRPTIGFLEGLYWLAGRIHPELMPELTKWKAGWQSRMKTIGLNMQVLDKG